MGIAQNNEWISLLKSCLPTLSIPLCMCSPFHSSSSDAKIKLESEDGDEVTITGLDKTGFLQVKKKDGSIRSVQPDGNTFDMLKNLISMKPGKHWAQFWAQFHKAFFQWQMTKISDESVDNQSEARISVACNKNCHLSLMTRFCETPPWSIPMSFHAGWCLPALLV